MSDLEEAGGRSNGEAGGMRSLGVGNRALEYHRRWRCYYRNGEWLGEIYGINT